MLGAALAAVLWVSDQVGDVHDRRNPASSQACSVWADSQVPQAVLRVLSRSCADCHSNRVRWPYISLLPLAGTMIESDVARARRRMNLSEWTKLRGGSQEEVQGLLNGICEETRVRNMPPRRYTVMHPGTAVSAKESEAICRWTGSPLNYPAAQSGGFR